MISFSCEVRGDSERSDMCSFCARNRARSGIALDSPRLAAKSELYACFLTTENRF